MEEPDSPALVEMRRDLDSVTTQMAHLTRMATSMQVANDQQHYQQQQLGMIARQYDPPTRPTARHPDKNDKNVRHQQQQQQYDPQQQQKQNDRPTD